MYVCMYVCMHACMYVCTYVCVCVICVSKRVCTVYTYTGELGYDGLNGTRKIGPSYAKSVVYI